MYEVYVNDVKVDATTVEFDDPPVNSMDVPKFMFALPNPAGMALTKAREGDTVKIRRAQELRFVGTIESLRVSRRTGTVEFTGRDKNYLALMDRICEYYRAWNGRYSPAINPWNFSRVNDEASSSIMDGLRPDELARAIIGTRFYWQEHFQNEDAIYKKSNCLIEDGIASDSITANSGDTGFVESVPLHNGPDIVSPMGTARAATIHVHGAKSTIDPTLKISRDGGFTYHKCRDVSWDGTKWTGSTKFLNALYFDGVDDEVTVTHSASYRLNGDFTIAWWGRMSAFANTYPGFWKFSNPATAGDGWLVWYDANGRLTLKRDNVGKASPNGLVTTEWAHYAIVYEEAAQKLHFYKDFAVESTLTGVTFQDSAGTGGLRMGAADEFGKHYMFDARLYARALDKDEVKAAGSFEYEEQDGLVGHWKMNEGTGTTIADSSSGNNDGTFAGGATWVEPTVPKYLSGVPTNGYAVSFTGLTTSTVEHKLNLNGNKDAGVSLSAFVKVHSSVSTATLVEKVNVWKVDLTSNVLSFWVMNGGTYYKVAEASEALDDAWRHIAFSWRPGEYGYIYIDGADKTEKTPLTLVSSFDHTTEGQLRFGAWQGLLDDFVVYTRGIQPNEIVTLFENKAIIGNGMVLELLFEEGSGTEAKDTSFNGANATLGADTTWTNSTARDNKSKPVYNHLAYKIEFDGDIAFNYVKLDAETDSDTGIAEGEIETYYHPFPDGSDRVQVNLTGQRRLAGLEQVRRLTVATDESVSPNWDMWITPDAKLHFKQVRGDRNTLKNASFENAGQSWAAEAKSGLAVAHNNVDDAFTRTGRIAWRVKVDTAPTADGDNYAGARQEVTLPAATGAYELTAYVRRESGTVKPRLIIAWLQSDGTHISSTDTVLELSTSQLWKKHRIESTRPANAAKAKVYVRGQYPTTAHTGDISFDDVRFEPVRAEAVYSYEEMNLDELERTSNGEIVNKVVAKGAGTEPYAMTIMGDTLKDVKSIEKYGERVGYFTDTSITDVVTLQNRARAFLELMAWPRQEVRATLVNDWECPWRVGDRIRVEDDQTNSTGTLRVMKAQYAWTGIERITVDLTNAAPTFGGVMREMDQSIRNAKMTAPGAVSQGTGAGLAIRMGKNQDGAVQAAVHEIVITEPESVNRIFISLKTEAFDAFVKSVASGGGHTSGSGGYTSTTTANSGNHEHQVFNVDAATTSNPSYEWHSMSFYDLNGNIILGYLPLAVGESPNDAKSYSIGGHQHAFEVPNHTHAVSDHTHPMKHGIYQLKDGTGIIFPTNLGLYVGKNAFDAGATFSNTATFGDETKSVEYRRIDISNATNPDGSFVFRDAEGKFVAGNYQVYVKPTAATARNAEMLGKIVINSLIERQRIG